MTEQQLLAACRAYDPKFDRRTTEGQARLRSMAEAWWEAWAAAEGPVFDSYPATPDGLKAARLEVEAVERATILEMEQRHGINSEEFRAAHLAQALPDDMAQGDIGRWNRALAVEQGEERATTRQMGAEEKEALRAGCEGSDNTYMLVCDRETGCIFRKQGESPLITERHYCTSPNRPALIQFCGIAGDEECPLRDKGPVLVWWARRER